MKKLLLTLAILAISSQVMARQTYFSDGSSATSIGDTTYFSDGSSARTIGNHTYYSDGSSSMTF